MSTQKKNSSTHFYGRYFVQNLESNDICLKSFVIMDNFKYVIMGNTFFSLSKVTRAIIKIGAQNR
jgi:hypothetical protein